MNNKNDKKSVISLIETTVRRVTLAYAPIGSPFLYVVTDYSKKLRAIISCKYFNDIDDAENFMFENYVYMIIPTSRFLNEGSNVFLY